MGGLGLLFLALSSTLFVLQFDLNSAQTHVSDFCNINPGANYTANSTFEANLNLLLSSMSNNTNQFYNNTVGRGPDRVYGLFQCRGDYNSQDCHRCARIAIEAITVNCPYEKESIIFYDECWLHYSHTSFVSMVQFEPTANPRNKNNISDPNWFTPVLNELMDGLVVQAVSNASSLFAAGKTNYTTSQKLYGLVQCTQDLSAGDCNRCLRRAVSEFQGCCDRKQGARVIKPSCNARYEIYEFFQSARTRIPPNMNTTTGDGRKSSYSIILIVVLTTIVASVLYIIAIFFCLRRKKRTEIVNDDVDGISTVESLQFNLAAIAVATDNFTDANWLGEGGFGAVYKGKLSDGQEIAVKRLSRNSGQGVKEFKNEVLLLARLQHRHLVRLLGFCLEGKENLLIYEFVSNSSLDKFIFAVDPIKRTSLDWESRYKIIGGIARGLLYLHEDSQDMIIHRDLKASNVLLDAQMNPKISDFGLARLFVVDQTHGTTSRIVGTHGYMAPEYAMQGHFSVKSDVFSFGVLVLEIISGHKNNSLYGTKRAEDLLSYALRQWEEGTALELLEPTCMDRYSRSEVMRCIEIGLLCVQEEVARRPTMASVFLMLSSYSFSLPLPISSTLCSVDEVSVTEL